MSYIISNQYVRIEPRAASIGPRIVAFVLDAIFLFIFNMGLTTLFFVFVNDYVGDIWLVLWLLTTVFLTLFYFPLMESFFNGRSIGKMLMGLRVVKRDGGVANFTAYIIRWLLLFVDAGIPFVGMMAALLSPLGQRLGDMAAGTMVISERTLRINRVNLMEYSFLTSKYKPVFAGAEKLTDGQVEAVHLALRQAGGNAVQLIDMCSKVAAIVGPVPPGWTAYEYLNTVWRDAQYYKS